MSNVPWCDMLSSHSSTNRSFPSEDNLISLGECLIASFSATSFSFYIMLGNLNLKVRAAYEQDFIQRLKLK